ncbi:MAG: NADH-quinone oxidoreductase subunit E [Methylomonas sp.]|nr:NADH-quinone oxidoreductase subunit E [Methylomonas sp.]PPD20865.1 MAG: NADH-quinone oxidoreductase subunit E [Methylomonas sp.]PPD26346.1 MAG: NADH-quinone oxidoreductase subunit E [Methylomonas sp.]PPD38067.1 MAG: NADH-quinone oxidoreductase subunit E [Methylomonas sp.]PPD40296.1 MAG: NADH-quinone oxidoreductase subunit E [Methylomonas sp.]
MNVLLLACVLLPLLGFVLILCSPDNEHRIAAISLWITRLKGVAVLGLLAGWAIGGFANYEYQWLMLYQHDNYQFPLLFFLDKVGAAYLFVVWAIFSAIVKYCRVYLHREPGYKRFFKTIFGFVFGLNLIVLAGSIDMLFAGWEIVGISSFLLIAFYRQRPQPIRNALRAYTIYRFCDVGLLIGTWMSHMLFHESQHFSELLTLFDHHNLPPAGYAALAIMSWLIILAASGKSAQFPFCFWLPRAMEGPTPSSAIFYGALSIHLGVFLLLRTLPIWSYHYLPRLIVLSIGALTVLIASLSEKTQSNIKGQVAYASITQVGLMFIELALGLESLVLLHFMGNAFLRCYQLLVSPSIVAHLLRVEGNVDGDFYINSEDKLSFLPVSIRQSVPEVLQNTLYVFALQEGHLELLVRTLLWNPLKTLGKQFNALSLWIKWLAALALLTIIAIAASDVSGMAKIYLSMPVSLAMAVVSLSAFSNKHSPYQVWHSVTLSSLLAGVAVWMMAPDASFDVLLFFSGILPSWALGVVAMAVLLRNDNFAASPFVFRAFAQTRPGWSLALLLSFLGLIGFPITPAFLGEDLLLSHASSQHPWFALSITISFVINGIAAARMYLRLCMGQPVELRSSGD